MRAIPAEAKKQAVQEMRESLRGASNVFLTAFEGLTVSEADELRARVLAAGGRMQVVKNRLLKIAIEGTQFEALRDLLRGPNAITYCGADPIQPLKVLSEFAAAHNQPPVKGAV
ncbi:MAG: 50S ribosomal protein L10, partial [Armatimonadota bacterium]